jgi:uridine kinase
VSQDSFYKSLTPEQSKLVSRTVFGKTLAKLLHPRQAFDNQYDFDTPAAFDWETLRECISELRRGQACEIPVYSFALHQRTEETQYLYGASVVILEGIFVLSDPELRGLMDMKIYGA